MAKMKRYQKVILWVAIIVILSWYVLIFLGLRSCTRSKEAKSAEAAEMFQSFPQSDNFVLLTHFELVIRGIRTDRSDITFNGLPTHIVFLAADGFYSYAIEDTTLKMTFLYTTYADLRAEVLGEVTLPSKLSFNCFFYEESFWYSVNVQADDHYESVCYCWSIADRAAVEKDGVISRGSPFDHTNYRDSDYTITSSNNLPINYKLKITEKSTGITKTIGKKILKTFPEGKRIKRAGSSTSFAPEQAYVVGDDVYFTAFYGVDILADDLYIYVLKWNFRTEECSFVGYVHFDSYQKQVDDFIILD
jgi:hypothetical protein